MVKHMQGEQSGSTIFINVPIEAYTAARTLERAGFQAFLIGGCTRDALIGREAKDWDITTNAKPDEIIALFPKTFYENDYGTVGVVFEESTNPAAKIIEVTPFREEGEYSDKRRPDEVSFSNDILDDLKRRDFTVNAIALRLAAEKDGSTAKENNGWAPKGGNAIPQGHVHIGCTIVDPFGGLRDLSAGIIRAVGVPQKRFTEDALRLLRAVRISTVLNFSIEAETERAVLENAHLIAHVSAERIRIEFEQILLSDNPMFGLTMTHKLGLLHHFIPELEQGIGTEQNQAHAYDVWEHLLRTVQHAADKKWSLEVRLAALFHDIGKPATRRKGPKGEWTFYGHEVVGAKMTRTILERLKFPRDTIEMVTVLVRWHMFFSDTESITLSAVRRMVANVGKDRIWDLMNIRVCDRIGTGRPKENPYRLRKYKAMVEEAMRDPVSVGMLKIDGNILIKKLGLKPGPKIGLVLLALLEEVLEDPALNTAKYLEERAQTLIEMPEDELRTLGEEGKKRKEAAEEAEIKEIRGKYKVT